MQTAIKKYIPLFKLRISILITFSAVVGLIAGAPRDVAINTLFFLIAATMMASMGTSAFNHYFDADIDVVMKRTSNRPLPSGNINISISPVVAISAVLLLAASLALSMTKLHYMAGVHLMAGAFVYAVVYTVWLKRRSWINIIIGGLAGSFAVLAGGASASSEFCALPAMLSVVMFFWTPSHFWSFAIVHKDEYGKAGIPMLPNVIGDYKTAIYILLNTTLLVASSFIPFYTGHLGVIYAVAAAALGAYFIIKNIQLIFNTTKPVAWQNFKASMLYLGVLFTAVIVDALAGI